jgi:hypothetical protein
MAAGFFVCPSGTGNGSTAALCDDVAGFNAKSDWSNGDVAIFKSEVSYTVTPTAAGIGTLNGFTIRASVTGDGDWGDGTKDWNSDFPDSLPNLGNNVVRAMLINESNLTNLTIQNFDVSGLDWYGSHAGIYTLRIDNVNTVVLDGIYSDGHSIGSTPHYRSSVIYLRDIGGDITVKNGTYNNILDDTDTFWNCHEYDPTTQQGEDDCQTYYGGGDANAILIYSDPVKTSGTIAIFDNTGAGVESDFVQLYHINTTTNIYGNTFTKFGENAVDVKGSGKTNIYENTFTRNIGLGADMGSNETIVVHPQSGQTPADVIIEKNIIQTSDYFGTQVEGCSSGCIIRFNWYINNSIDSRVSSPSGLLVNGNVFVKKSITSYSSFGNPILWFDNNGSTNTTIRDNTGFIDDVDSLYAVRFGKVGGQNNHQNTTLSENIFKIDHATAGTYLILVDEDTGYDPVLDRNLYFADSGNECYEGGAFKCSETGNWYDVNALTADPQFKDEPNNDFTLGPLSAAIIYGTARTRVNPGSTWPSSVTTGTFKAIGAFGACVPDTPSISDPTGSETGVELNREVDSSAYADQTGCSTSHTSSDWEIDTINTFPSPDKFTYDDAVNKITWTPTMPENSELYIRVRHTNSIGDSAWSDPVYFETVGGTPPGGSIGLLVSVTGFTGKWIQIDCEGEEGTGLKWASGATGGTLYDSTIVNCGTVGLDADESITAKNVLLNNNAGPDINIDTGKTVTASNNSIQDAAKAGAGTYDSGTSDFSKVEVFYDFAGGDLRLRRSSYGVDKGTSAIYSGVEVDIFGKAVTDGSGDPVSGAEIDIGAFESTPYMGRGPLGMGLGIGLN